MNIKYEMAGRMNNQTARGTLRQIDHLLRLTRRAQAAGDKRAAATYGRLARNYIYTDPAIFLAAMDLFNQKQGVQTWIP